jgi:hypothetical protein
MGGLGRDLQNPTAGGRVESSEGPLGRGTSDPGSVEYRQNRIGLLGTGIRTRDPHPQPDFGKQNQQRAARPLVSDGHCTSWPRQSDYRRDDEAADSGI